MGGRKCKWYVGFEYPTKLMTRSPRRPGMSRIVLEGVRKVRSSEGRTKKGGGGGTNEEDRRLNRH